jgi:hypothetical protein
MESKTNRMSAVRRRSSRCVCVRVCERECVSSERASVLLDP